MAKAHLNEPSPAVTPKVVEEYQRDGHVCIRDLIDAETVLSYRPIIEEISESWRYEKAANRGARNLWKSVSAGT